MATPDDLRRRVKCAGGWCPNERGTLCYSAQMDEIDNADGHFDLLEGTKTTETQHTYRVPKPNCVRPPKSCSPSETGYSRTGPPHAPASEPFALSKEMAKLSVNCEDRLDKQCKVPTYLRGTEQKASYRIQPSTLARAGLLPVNRNLMAYFPTTEVKPQIQQSGYTRAFNANPLDGRHMDPVWVGAVPNMGRVGPSTTHQDYLPTQYRSGYEHNLPINMTGRTVTSYNRDHELEPCFQERTWKGPCASNDFLSQYTTDYKMQKRCEGLAMNIVENVIKTIKKREDVNLFRGQGTYETETKGRYTPPGPEGRARHGHLRGAVGHFNHTSGFAMSTPIHRTPWVPCPQPVFHPMTYPQQFNPWPRAVMGHQVILNKNYRPPFPRGAQQGVDYIERQIERPSIYGTYPIIQ